MSKSRHLSTAPEIEVQSLDHRLRLAKCTSPLKISLLPGSRTMGRVSARVRCEGKPPWTIYSSAFVKVFKNVVVLNDALPRDTEISASDLVLKKMEVSSLRSGYLSDPQKAVGKRLKRALQGGTPLNHRLLVTPKMIKKGDNVIILAKGGQFSIRMAGKALSDGAKGDLIRVQNIKSGRTIQAKIIAEGIVQTPL